LWMWPAAVVPTPWSLMLKHTRPVSGLSVIRAVPVPPPAFGTSFDPASDALSTVVWDEAAPLAKVRPATARASPTATAVMCLRPMKPSLLAAGPVPTDTPFLRTRPGRGSPGMRWPADARTGKPVSGGAPGRRPSIALGVARRRLALAARLRRVACAVLRQRLCQLLLAHLRAALDARALGVLVELGLRLGRVDPAVRVRRPRARRLAALGGLAIGRALLV